MEGGAPRAAAAAGPGGEPFCLWPRPGDRNPNASEYAIGMFKLQIIATFKLAIQTVSHIELRPTEIIEELANILEYVL